MQIMLAIMLADSMCHSHDLPFHSGDESRLGQAITLLRLPCAFLHTRYMATHEPITALMQLL